MKKMILGALSLTCFVAGTAALAAGSGAVGAGAMATNITASLGPVAKLITASSYVAGLAFAVGAVVKFKTHKDNPTQVPIGTPIAMLFVGAALIFIPSVFKAAGATLFANSGITAGPSGSVDLNIKK
jgi:intracellular multiplication protein IcmD